MVSRRQLVAALSIGALAGLYARTALAKLGPLLSTTELVRLCDAVVVGRVAKIDEQWHEDSTGPQTRIELLVSEVIAGSLEGVDLKSSKGPLRFAFDMRGGVRADGTRQVFSEAPRFEVGANYVLCLRSRYYLSPVVPSANALLRSVAIGGKLLTVSAFTGRGIVASPMLGLVQTRRFSMSESQGLASVSEAQRVASSFEDVIAILRHAAGSLPLKSGVVAGTPLDIPSEAMMSAEDPATESMDGGLPVDAVDASKPEPICEDL